ncbi:hypothetical protein C8F01DRAFT_1260515 [Mycena amicta]|nr:hypothetical protein C8F01DRAFT_1260515 [Mycena amicta]
MYTLGAPRGFRIWYLGTWRPGASGSAPGVSPPPPRNHRRAAHAHRHRTPSRTVHHSALPPPHENSEATLKQILARDDSVIPVLERDFLHCKLRATTLQEELIKANEVDAARREKLAAAIQNAWEYPRETEEELKREEDEARMVEEQKVYLQMHAALEDAKAKLAELEQVWKARYGVDKTV